MAITVSHASIGTPINATASSATIVFTTNVAIASGDFIVVGFGWADQGTVLNSVSGGGLTWAIDEQVQHTDAIFDCCAIVSAQAPSGLASGATITATLSGSCTERTAGGISFAGVASSSPVDTHNHGQDSVGGSGSNTWSSGNVTLAAGSVLVTHAYGENTTNSTPTSGTEAFQAFTSHSEGGAMNYNIGTTAGTYVNSGTWSATTRWCFCNVAYLAASGGGGGSPTVKSLAALGVG